MVVVQDFLELSATAKRQEKGKSLLISCEDYVVVDLETTGLDPSFCNIIEIGAIKVKSGEAIEKFVSLINPRENIDPFITQLTGITNEMLRDAPLFESVAEDLLGFIGADIIVGHNVNFDINFLYDKLISCIGLGVNNDFIDTLRMSRRLFPELPNHKLQTLIHTFNLGDCVSHRSLSDCEQTMKCYEYLKKYISDNNVDLSQYLSHSRSIRAKDIAASTSSFDECHPLFGKTCVFTGTLERMSRREAMQFVVDHGGICGDSITRKTNFLIMGNNDFCSSIKDGKSSKQKKAEALILKGADIEIMSESVFYDMLDV